MPHDGRSDEGNRRILPPHPDPEETLELLRSMDEWVLDRQVELTGIPAPPFQEGARGRRMAELLSGTGLQGVAQDSEGNIVGQYSPESEASSSRGDAPAPLVVSAHLDTVFPPGTDVRPRREGDRIEAPGISDDGRGLAALLGLARILTTLSPSLPFPLLLVATVGEEGAGNLRGVRHLFSSDGKGHHARGFISLDGVGLKRIIHRGVGSSRLRVLLRGSGGHSWTEFGSPNPIHALSRIVATAQAIPLSSDPKTTLTAARWGGGRSINSIPEEAWVELDLRSEAPEELEFLEGELLRVCQEESGGEKGQDGTPEGLLLEIREIGRRPAGFTHLSDPLVQAAADATRIVGEEPIFLASSTDANLPMSLGVPAITLGAGGTGGGIHTDSEWYLNRKGPEGILRILLTLLLLR